MPKTRTIRSLLLALCAFQVLSLVVVRSLTGDNAVEFPIEIYTPDETGKPASSLRPRTANPMHALVVFTKFKGEAPGDSLVPSWSRDLFSGQPGSVSDYFHTVSFGQFKVSGEIYPRLIEMPYGDDYYKTDDIYCPDVIRILDQDPSFRFAKYDNDGFDGIPNSGDDDGFVDFIILMPRTRPYDFIMKLATGVMSLAMGDPYITDEFGPFGERIIVDRYSGCLAVARNRTEGIGTVTAEIAHAFDALDLMDKSYDIPESDSAGAGYWDVLAWGANGWGVTGVPVGPCAYNRIRMNCAGVANSNLVDLYGSRQGVRIRPSSDPDGKIYRIWMNEKEYFLIEHRNNEGGFYYDMQLPGSGLMIWHVKENESNSDEYAKLCDLECPDGLYRDKGYPYGEKPDPADGGDNLDFWARDITYRNEHGGNCGDITDIFDGVKYTEFNEYTNPDSRPQRSSYPSPISVYNIRREGQEMVFDCVTSPVSIVQPPQLPALGLGFQRSRATAPEVDGIGKKAYLVTFGPGAGPDLLVAVSPERLDTLSTTDLSSGIVQKLVMRSLTGGREPENAIVTRENVPAKSFAAMLREFDLEPEDLAGGQPPRLVQELTLTENDQALPFVLELRQNYPNPFNAETVIPYILSASGPVMLEVYNILGQKVLELDQGYRIRGVHSARLTARDLSSGVYFYRLRGADLSQTRRFTLIR